MFSCKSPELSSGAVRFVFLQSFFLFTSLWERAKKMERLLRSGSAFSPLPLEGERDKEKGFFAPAAAPLRGQKKRTLSLTSLFLKKNQKTAFVWTIESVAPAANVLSPTGRAGHAGAFMVEFLLTFLLMWVTLSATDAARYRNVSHLPVLAPLAIGMTYFIAHMAAIPIDGCSINPARFLGTFTLSGVGGWAMVREKRRFFGGGLSL